MHSDKKPAIDSDLKPADLMSAIWRALLRIDVRCFFR